MVPFTQARVELHGETDYTKLHEAMAKEGYSRTVKHDGATVPLPIGEYCSASHVSADAAIAAAKRAAASTGKRFLIAMQWGDGANWRYGTSS